MIVMRTSRLPIFVQPNAQAGFYSAANKNDMQRLANVLHSLHGQDAASLAAAMVSMRVMFPPLLYRIPAWIWVKRGREEMLFWARAFAHPRVGEKLTRAILADAARWATDGQDREDSNSVGGFSQREVNFIANAIGLVRSDITAREAA